MLKNDEEVKCHTYIYNLSRGQVSGVSDLWPSMGLHAVDSVNFTGISDR